MDMYSINLVINSNFFPFRPSCEIIHYFVRIGRHSSLDAATGGTVALAYSIDFEQAFHMRRELVPFYPSENWRPFTCSFFKNNMYMFRSSTTDGK